jgi:hypothetical protein
MKFRNAYPMIVTLVYLTLGLLFHLWSVAWLLYLTIPIVYTLLPAKKEKKDEKKHEDWSNF